MAWDIEYTDEFEGWWETLTEDAQIDVDVPIADRLYDEYLEELEQEGR